MLGVNVIRKKDDIRIIGNPFLKLTKNLRDLKLDLVIKLLRTIIIKKQTLAYYLVPSSWA